MKSKTSHCVIYTSILVGFLVLANLAIGNSKQEPEKQRSNQVKAAQPKVKLKDFNWIAGHWQGEAMGGKFEETWNPAFGGSMMGMFKFVDKDGIGFYEILTIVEEKEKIVLRLKHFDKSLVGWEEKDKSVEFPFVSLSKTEAIFDGLKFIKVDDSTMNVHVKVKEGEKVEELKLPFKRVQTK